MGGYNDTRFTRHATACDVLGVRAMTLGLRYATACAVQRDGVGWGGRY